MHQDESQREWGQVLTYSSWGTDGVGTSQDPTPFPARVEDCISETLCQKVHCWFSQRKSGREGSAIFLRSSFISAMPTVSQFFGIIIHMYIRGEHNPPHFHALYAEYEALINIQTLAVIEGHLPRRALGMVLEWANEHRNELIEDWNLCRAKQLPKAIKPLE